MDITTYYGPLYLQKCKIFSKDATYHFQNGRFNFNININIYIFAFTLAHNNSTVLYAHFHTITVKKISMVSNYIVG